MKANKRELIAVIITAILLISSLFFCCSKAQADEAVIVTDFTQFTPSEAFADPPTIDKWHIYHALWATGGSILNSGGGIPSDISYNPNLKGKYDLYVGVRRINASGRFQLQVGQDNMLYTIDPGQAEGTHISMEIMYAANVEMTGKSITIHHYGDAVVFLDYLKFVAAGASADKISDKHVTREPKRDFKLNAKELKSHVPDGFIEKEYRDDSPMPELSMQDRTRGYVLFEKHYMDLVFPVTIPKKEEIKSTLGTFASIGEYEPVTFAVRPQKDLRNVQVSVSDLKDKNNNIIPKNFIDVRLVRLLNKRVGFYRGREFMAVPTFLEKKNKVNILKNTTTQFWITVKVPDDAKAGNYRGKVFFTPEGIRGAELVLKLTVLPIKLPEIEDYSIGMFDYSTKAITKDPDFLENKFHDMREHNMTSVGWYGPARLNMVLNNGQIQVIFDGTSDLEKVMNAYREAGFPAPMFWLMERDFERWIIKNADCSFGSETFGDLFKQVMRQIIQKGEQEGWSEILFQPIDEPYSRNVLPEALILSKLVKEAGGNVIITHYPFQGKNQDEDRIIKQTIPYLDISDIRYSTEPTWHKDTWEDTLLQAKELGKTLYTYNINGASTMSEMTTMRFSSGFFFWTIGKGIKGQHYWIYQSPIGSLLYNDLDGNSNDWLYVYPPREIEDEIGGPSLIWEALREGVDDLKYISLLSDLIEQGEKVFVPEDWQIQKTAENAKKKLDNIFSSFDFDLMRQQCYAIESKWEVEELDYVSGRYKLPNGWDFDDYDKARRAIADEIIKLQRLRGN